MSQKRWICGLLVGSALAMSCGGGGGGGEGGTDGRSAVQEGFLTGLAASGLSYETSTQSGVTDVDGAFSYVEGEVVAFYLGGTPFGEASAQDAITPFDLVGIEPITGLKREQMTDRNFRRVHNLTVLLQTLDYDEDPTNGIEITPEVAELFVGVQVDLTPRVEDFRTERSFRTVLNQINANALVQGHRVVRNGALALNDLYGALDLDPRLFAPRRWASDDDADETIETAITFEYESRGFLARTDTVEAAEEGEEPFAFVQVDVHDERGNPTRRMVDDDADGTADETDQFVYDVDANLEQLSTDIGADGVIDSLVEMEYNEFGERVVRRSDDDGDGSFDGIVVFQYDERGHNTVREDDDDADGTVDTRTTYERDENGYATRIERDDHADGEINWILVTERNADGRVTRSLRDEDANGEFDNVVINIYDASGHPVRSEEDRDGDGVLDAVKTTVYDDEGNRIRWERDDGVDGVADVVVTYTHDANGNEIERRTDSDADGTADRIVVVEYVPQSGWGYLFSEFF